MTTQMTAPPLGESALIRLLARHSDRYGRPHETGFLEETGLRGFREATAAQLEDYARRKGLLEEETA